MGKKLTWSEELVGRPLPKEASYADQIMSGYVKEDGTFCGRIEPSVKWHRAPFTKIKRSGWVKPGFSFGKGMMVYFLTERGEQEAVAAKQRVMAAWSERAQWSKDFTEAYRKLQEAA